MESLYAKAQTVAINENGTGAYTVHSVDAGVCFVVLAIYLVTGGAATVEFKSGANAISGLLKVSDTSPLWLLSDSFSLFKGNPGENFIIDLVGAVDLDGFAVLMESSV